MKIYVVARTFRARTVRNERATFMPGNVVGDQLSPEILADAVARGYVTEQTAMRDPRPAPVAEETPAPVVTKTNEGLNADALAELHENALLAAVAERVSEDCREAVMVAITEAAGPKQAAIDFLLADYGDRIEYANAIKQVAEEAEAIRAKLRE